MSRAPIQINVNNGIPWFVGWMFTIAFSHLGGGHAILAVIAWPYYLGDTIATLAGVR